MPNRVQAHWKEVSVTVVVLLACITSVAVLTRKWFITAIPIGFLFGFFLEKADLCGASAFSEVILMKDWRKIHGLLVLIVVSMLGFALLVRLGVIKLNPRPLEWATMIVGGAVFGAGIVLAGGCISGALYKSGAGNLNSMAALVGIPLGVAFVEHGPLQGFHRYLKQFVIRAADGSPVTLASLTGVRYETLAIVFAFITVVAALIIPKRRRQMAMRSSLSAASLTRGVMERIITRPWKPWHSGILIGLLACGAYVSSAASGRNYPLGVTHGVLYTQLMLTDYPLTYVYGPPTVPQPPSPPQGPSQPKKKVTLWLVLEVTSLVPGAFVSARLTGRGKLLPKPPEETFVAFFGGIITGIGAGIAGYCVVGGIMSGWALMSIASLIFGVTTVLANWTMTYFYLMGGTLRR